MTSAGEAGRDLDPALTVPDHGAAPSSRDLEGAPSVPSEAREERLALKSGTMFVCARRDGDIRPGRASGEGLYADDTRHLSELRLAVGELQPVLLSSIVESGHHAVINATNPARRARDAPDKRLTVDRPRLPDWLSSVDIADIRVGPSRLSLSFRQTGSGSTGFSLLQQQGDVRVTMSV